MLILQVRRASIERESLADTLWRIKLEMVLNCGAKENKENLKPFSKCY